MRTYTLTIGWLYPDLMSTYGDRGNIMVLKKRAEARGIEVKVNEIYAHSDAKEIEESDLLFMGGAQDTQQEIVVKDLSKTKGKILKNATEKGTPGLYICGAYQFLGKHYKTADGKKLSGLGVFPLHTESKRGKRLIGNVVASPNNEELKQEIVGFENHGGRTYLEDKKLAFATIVNGFGNNGEDTTEGIMLNNSIGTYFHGPILPKNPEIADFLLLKSLEKKYGRDLHLEPLDDSLERNARKIVIGKFS